MYLLASPPGRVRTALPAGAPNPLVLGRYAPIAPTLLLEPSGGRCGGAQGDLDGPKHRLLSRCQLCQMDTLEAPMTRSLRGQEGGS